MHVPYLLINRDVSPTNYFSSVHTEMVAKRRVKLMLHFKLYFPIDYDSNLIIIINHLFDGQGYTGYTRVNTV